MRVKEQSTLRRKTESMEWTTRKYPAHQADLRTVLSKSAQSEKETQLLHGPAHKQEAKVVSALLNTTGVKCLRLVSRAGWMMRVRR